PPNVINRSIPGPASYQVPVSVGDRALWYDAAPADKPVNRREQGSPVEGRRGRVTLVDVARAAGVSKAVASAVLSGASGSVRASPATRAQIIGTARQLGYAPHYAARSLRRRRANRITLVVHSLANPYYADI